MAIPHSSAQVLLVEGQDDKYVVRHLWAATEAVARFGIEDKGGVGKLLESIPVEIKAPGRKAVGILADANRDRNARWQAIAERLRRVNVVLPDSACPDGIIIQEKNEVGRPRVGVWLLPDNESPGELEDFIANMIPPNDVVWPLSRKYIQGIPEPRRFKGKVRKAEVHAWLATLEKPRPMGLAIKARDLDVKSDLCMRFVAWLRRLFGEEQT